MAKVSVNKNSKVLSPSEEVIKNANMLHYTVDSNGRQIAIKIPSFQDNLKYDLYFGKYEETNKRFYESNKFSLFIKEIDGDNVPFPCNDSEALALAARVGNEGMSAVMEKINEIMGDELEDAGSEESVNEEKSTIKK